MVTLNTSRAHLAQCVLVVALGVMVGPGEVRADQLKQLKKDVEQVARALKIQAVRRRPPFESRCNCPERVCRNPRRCTPARLTKLTKAAASLRVIVDRVIQLCGDKTSIFECKQLVDPENKVMGRSLRTLLMLSLGAYLGQASNCEDLSKQKAFLDHLFSSLSTEQADLEQALIKLLSSREDRAAFYVVIYLLDAMQRGAKGTLEAMKQRVGHDLGPLVGKIKRGEIKAAMEALTALPPEVQRHLLRESSTVFQNHARLLALLSTRKVANRFSVVALDPSGVALAPTGCAREAARLLEQRIQGKHHDRGFRVVRDPTLDQHVLAVARAMARAPMNTPRRLVVLPQKHANVLVNRNIGAVITLQLGRQAVVRAAFIGEQTAVLYQPPVPGGRLPHCRNNKAFGEQLQRTIVAPLVNSMVLRNDYLERALRSVRGVMRLSPDHQFADGIKLVGAPALDDPWLARAGVPKGLCVRPISFEGGAATGWPLSREFLPLLKRAFERRLPVTPFNNKCRRKKGQPSTGQAILEWKQADSVNGKLRYTAGLFWAPPPHNDDTAAPTRLPMVELEVDPAKYKPQELADVVAYLMALTLQPLPLKALRTIVSYEHCAKKQPAVDECPSVICPAAPPPRGKRSAPLVLASSLIPGVPLAVEPRLGHQRWYAYTQAALVAIQVAALVGLVFVESERRVAWELAHRLGDPQAQADEQTYRGWTYALGGLAIGSSVASVTTTSIAYFKISDVELTAGPRVTASGVGLTLTGSWF